MNNPFLHGKLTSREIKSKTNPVLNIDIMAKFHELTWLERSRLSQAANNPSPDFRWARPQGQHTRKLDRYANIQPWDNHRVKLQVPDGHMDYINASPIILTPSSHPTSDGRTAETREPDRYIAMQGPKKQSLDHTWRMIVEQLESPAVIVMLTETHEGYVEKCFPYFPRTKDDAPLEINEQDEFGDGFRATVRCEGIEETPAGDAIELRKLVIRVHSRGGNGGQNDSPVSTPSPIDNHPNDEMRSPFTDKEDAGLPSALAEAEPRRAFDHGSFDSSPSPSSPRSSGDHNGLAGENEVEERVVWHFLYKKWPDFGVPKQGDLESFFTLMRLSREKNAGPHNPRIVHCSAGVGRSGTFIALEHLIRELDAGVLEHYDERLATPPPLSAHSPSGSGTGNDGSSGGRSGNSSPATTKEEEGEDLIFSVVNQLREQRGSMVQAEVQYLFIYMVMRKLWRDKYSKYGTDGDEGQGEPAAKRLEVDPFVA